MMELPFNDNSFDIKAARKQKKLYIY